MSGVRAGLEDRRFWCGLGLVYKPDGEDSHFEVDGEVGVLVNVELMPDREPLLCRLGGLGSGGTGGVWKIPPVGSEVVVVVDGGDIGGETYIVGVLSSGGTPSELDETTLVIKSPKVTIIATEPGGAVEIGQKGLTPLVDGLVHGSAVDPYTGATYAVLGATTSTLRAKK